MIWMALEDHERALDALERYIERDLPPFSASTPLLVSAYDPVRNEPRFRAILAKRGLEGLTLTRLERADTP